MEELFEVNDMIGEGSFSKVIDYDKDFQMQGNSNKQNLRSQINFSQVEQRPKKIHSVSHERNKGTYSN